MLQELNLRPSRRLGQNYLHDQNLARIIVDFARVGPEDAVVEIGPGLGALTEILREKTNSLRVVEKDTRAAEWLRARFPDIQVAASDALEVDFNVLLAPGSGPWICIGNLPYSTASRMMVMFCELPNRPIRMVFTVQREVADRLVAKPGSADYGLLTLLTQPFYSIHSLRQLPTSVFYPEPDVLSTVVGFERVECALAPAQLAKYRGLVKNAFQKRRKTLRAIFAKELPANLRPDARPEDVPVEAWLEAAK
ncbi:MAG: ribosomal RNA small subunit methyltransferase A [Verrucomicrobiae bacterium]|nr:ribosomal RNA small subunit methyltransferase A [Verrucomicrobiae bacterium]